MRVTENRSSDSDFDCVWVKAGLIASKICDVNFDCENCPLDAALRKGFRAPRKLESHRSSTRSAGIEGSELDLKKVEVREKILDSFFHELEFFSLWEGRYYYKAHTWVQDGQRMLATVGIDDLAAKMLPHVNSVAFPSVRSHLLQGEYCAWFVGSEGTVSFVSPVTGTIVAVNDDLFGTPDLVRTSPYEKGWLARIELDNFHLDLKKLLPKISATTRCRKDIERLRRQMLVHLRVDIPPPGVTLFDGGKYVENVQTLFGLRKYIELISVLFKP